MTRYGLSVTWFHDIKERVLLDMFVMSKIGESIKELRNFVTSNETYNVGDFRGFEARYRDVGDFSMVEGKIVLAIFALLRGVQFNNFHGLSNNCLYVMLSNQQHLLPDKQNYFAAADVVTPCILWVWLKR